MSSRRRGGPKLRVTEYKLIRDPSVFFKAHRTYREANQVRALHLFYEMKDGKDTGREAAFRHPRHHSFEAGSGRSFFRWAIFLLADCLEVAGGFVTGALTLLHPRFKVLLLRLAVSQGEA